MHNDFLQIAAERGIPGLMLWLWLMIHFAHDALKVFRAAARGDPAIADQKVTAATVSAAALGAWAAIMVAGMFEYNFGDSEVLTLFLFIVSSPYAIRYGHAHPSEVPLQAGRGGAPGTAATGCPRP
jgi:O-antigen ligase